MPTIETKEIGIPIGIGSGNHINTEFINGYLQLKVAGETENQEAAYEKEGYWESKVVDTVDKFREYDKIAVTKIQLTKDLYKIETRTSDDGVSFNEYISITASSHILSPKKRYIQIKITLYAGLLSEVIVLSDFNSLDDVNKWEDNTYIETDGVLKLKRDYQFEMIEDTSWSDEGSLHRKLIVRDEWKRIDKIGVE